MLRIAAITAVSGSLLALTLAAGCDQTEYGEPIVDEDETMTPGYEDYDTTDIDEPIDDTTIEEPEDRQAATPPPVEAEAETTLVGVLEQTEAEDGSAWVLTGTDAGNVEVDITNVRDDITSLEGQRVLVSGELVERSDAAGGTMQVLVAERIEAA